MGLGECWAPQRDSGDSPDRQFFLFSALRMATWHYNIVLLWITKKHFLAATRKHLWQNEESAHVTWVKPNTWRYQHKHLHSQKQVHCTRLHNSSINIQYSNFNTLSDGHKNWTGLVLPHSWGSKANINAHCTQNTCLLYTDCMPIHQCICQAPKDHELTDNNPNAALQYIQNQHRGM